MEDKQSPAPPATGTRPEPNSERPKPEIVPPAATEENLVTLVNPEDPQLQWEQYENKVDYRKFDSEDAITLKSASLKGTIEDANEKIYMDMGAMQKTSIILGIKKCPWFSDMIGKEGITPEIYNRRNSLEFRSIPPEFLDKLFKNVMQLNRASYNKRQLAKN